MDLDETALIHVQQRLAALLYRHVPMEAIAGMAVAFVAAAGALGATGIVPAASLLGLLAACYAIRVWRSKAFARVADSTERFSRWLREFDVGAMVTGAAWGALAVVAIVSGQLIPGGIASFCAVLVCFTNVYTYGGAVTATIGFAVLALLPAATAFALQNDLQGFLIAAMLVLATMLVAIGGRLLRTMIWETLIMQGENAQLVSHLDQRRNQVEKLNVALKTNMDKREQAEVNLRRTAADLGLAQGKAKALADTLERVSPLCPVTGLINRRSFLEQIDIEWRRDQRERRPLTLIVVALDHFDEYAETYGRQSADALLKRITTVIKSYGKRASDQAARYGDHQLAVMLPGTDHRNASRIGEAIRARVEGQRIAHAGAPNREIVTVHIGVVTMIPARSLGSEELVKRVDSSIYEARFQGGNKTVVYQPLDKIKIQRWNRADDGPLNEQSLVQKLLLWGFDTQKSILKPGTTLPDKTVKEEVVHAVLTGQMLFIIEGTQVSVRTGDAVFIPAGTTFSAEVEGDVPVMSFLATRGA